MLSLEQLSLVVKDHLGVNINGIQHQNKWVIARSSLGGRGLFAAEDIVPGDVLFVDRPLIHGPRGSSTAQRGCTVCGRVNMNSEFKCNKCFLRLCCEECQNTDVHYEDCAIISRWHIKVCVEEVDDTLLSRALTPIRALRLDDKRRQFMASLQAHSEPQHGNEVRALKKYFDIPEEEEYLMILACRVLDANAHQIANPYDSADMSMRGLYPVASLMNHCCVPNTRHSFNNDSQMSVKAVKPISAGSEIFTCYSALLWGTPARRAQLYKTKHFFCMCDRCADPTERGTFLAALKCMSLECPGSLLPVEPLKASTPWRCLECDMKVPAKNIGAIQAAIGSLMGTLDFENVYQLERFLLERIVKFIPRTNQIVVDLQYRLAWKLGETEGLLWHELSESRLSLKESLCRGTLRTLAALGAGDAHLRGLLLYHLHATLAERARRRPALYEELKSEIEITIEQAHSILHGDISAPPDLELRRRYLGPGSNKPHEERFGILDSVNRN